MARKKQARRHKSTGTSNKKAAGKHVSGKKRATPKTKARAAKQPGTSAAPAGASATHALEMLRWTHALTHKLADGFAPEQALYQGTPTENHLLWTFGHLATAYSWFASLIDGKTAAIPESYSTLFYTNKPTGDASAYPALAEVREQCEKAYARLTDAIAHLSPADALKPPAAEAYGFATNRLDAAYKAIWHEGWHQGQLSTLRRALGMKGVF